MIKLLLPGPRDYFAPHQISNGVPAGTEVAIHAFRGSITRNVWEPGRVALFISARNTFNEVDRQLILAAVVIHAPGLTQYVNMVYGCAPWLIASRHPILSLQGTLQGDPLGMNLFSLFIQPIIDNLQATCAQDLNNLCADDGTLVGIISKIFKSTEIFQATGIAMGYYLEVSKSKLWWPTVIPPIVATKRHP